MVESPSGAWGRGIRALECPSPRALPYTWTYLWTFTLVLKGGSCLGVFIHALFLIVWELHQYRKYSLKQRNIGVPIIGPQLYINFKRTTFGKAHGTKWGVIGNMLVNTLGTKELQNSKTPPPPFSKGGGKKRCLVCLLAHLSISGYPVRNAQVC